MTIQKIYLTDEEYYHDEVQKSAIYLHHTAGAHRADWVVATWEKDKTSSGGVRHIATAYVIGGRSTRDPNDTDWDGVIVECFPPSKWAHHLGIRANNNRLLNKKCIGIEICNYGWLTLGNDGKYYTYVRSVVPEDVVVDLGSEFRDHRYYHKYTEAQIEATRGLVVQLAQEFGIDLKAGMQQLLNAKDLEIPGGLDTLGQQQWLNQHGFLGSNGKPLAEDGQYGDNTEYALETLKEASASTVRAFELDRSALAGAGGLWTHTNVRSDKSDLSPQPLVIDMIKSL